MRILRGGSTEIKSNQWFKFDIELDESDLQALIVKHNLDYSKLTVIQKFNLLSLQAELLVTVQMEQKGATGERSIAEYVAQLQDCINKLPKVAE